jgi:hypothetical protein
LNTLLPPLALERIAPLSRLLPVQDRAGIRQDGDDKCVVRGTAVGRKVGG